MGHTLPLSLKLSVTSRKYKIDETISNESLDRMVRRKMFGKQRYFIELIIIGTLIFVSGCASVKLSKPDWVKAGVTPEQLSEDREACDKFAGKILKSSLEGSTPGAQVVDLPSGGVVFRSYKNRKMIRGLCMELRGYSDASNLNK